MREKKNNKNLPCSDQYVEVEIMKCMCISGHVKMNLPKKETRDYKAEKSL